MKKSEIWKWASGGSTTGGPFSVLKGEKMIRNTKVMKNVANTSVMEWGGRLFANYTVVSAHRAQGVPIPNDVVLVIKDKDKLIAAAIGPISGHRQTTLQDARLALLSRYSNSRLFCLWEGGDPYEIDSSSLQTIGKLKLDKDNTNSPAHKTPKPHMANFWDVAAQILKPILYVRSFNT
ncbi:unnamed protein product [Cuscuta europaea]|uniref:Uncharacterized protein n=1 Tax=Cuscuta europaea TaxID=41803 RepID=A0A9P0ZDS0_CUSEU|nr:unnamed protein product [Cuscuta europaea]